MLITIATFEFLYDAYLLRGRLEAEGIPASVAFDGHVGADWPMAQALGGIAVQVPPSELDAAREIARAHAAGEYAITDDTGDDAPLPDAAAQAAAARPPACAHCGSEDVVRKVPMSRKVFALALFLLGPVVPTRESLWHCRHCYNDWPIAG